MSWRDTFKVHPAADCWPMLPGDEIDNLAEDIRKNGLKHPVVFKHDGTSDVLLDGRNRLEAMERSGIPFKAQHRQYLSYDADAHSYIISANARRRHMTKSMIAETIVKMAKLDQVDPVSDRGLTKAGERLVSGIGKLVDSIAATGGRGKKSPVKAKALEINKALPKEDQVSEPTIKRAIAKAEGKKPKPQQPQATPAPAPPAATIDAARRAYLAACENVDDLDAERGIVNEALREIAGKRIMAKQAARKATEKVAPVRAPSSDGIEFFDDGITPILPEGLRR